MLELRGAGEANCKYLLERRRGIIKTSKILFHKKCKTRPKLPKTTREWSRVSRVVIQKTTKSYQKFKQRLKLPMLVKSLLDF